MATQQAIPRSSAAAVSTHRRPLRDLVASRSLLPGPVQLSNGHTSNFYFDCKRVTLSPEGADLVAEVFLDALESLPEAVEAIGGLTHGADPILGAIMMRGLERGRRYSTFYVRKEPKKHGTGQWIENPPAPGTKVAIVDDVVTTGKSVLQAMDQAAAAGCEIVAVLSLVDRGGVGGDIIRQRCSRYLSIFQLEDFPEIQVGQLNPT